MIRTPIRRPILSFSASSAFSCAPFFIYLMFSVENIILRKVKKNSSRKCCTGWRSQSKSDSNLTQPFSYVSLIFLIYFNSNFNIYFFCFRDKLLSAEFGFVSISFRTVNKKQPYSPPLFSARVYTSHHSKEASSIFISNFCLKTFFLCS